MSSRRSGDRHGWNSLDNYIAVHLRRLDEFRGHFVVSESLQYEHREGEFHIRGRIECAHGLFLDVAKKLAINERHQVRTVEYSYHAGVLGPAGRTIFQYDNAHVYEREGHPDAHHRHRFDPQTWREIEPPEWIGAERWPHLSDVPAEIEAWGEAVGRHILPAEPE